MLRSVWLASVSRRSPVLAKALTNANPNVRYFTALSLGLFFGTNGVDAIPSLLHSLKDQESLVRHASADALGSIKMRPEIVVPALIGALDDTDVPTQLSAVLTLGEFGPLAKDAVPKLIKLIEASSIIDARSMYVSERAWEALKKIDPDAAAKFAPK